MRDGNRRKGKGVHKKNRGEKEDAKGLGRKEGKKEGRKGRKHGVKGLGLREEGKYSGKKGRRERGKKKG